MSYPPRQYWATHRTSGQVGPYKSREEAAEVFFATFLQPRECLTGYGTYGPHFDMGWTQRPVQEKPQERRQVQQVTPASSTNPKGWEYVG